MNGAGRSPDSRLPGKLLWQLYNIIPYGIDESGKIDYEDMAKQAKEHKPKMIIGGFSAYPVSLTGQNA